MTHFQREPTARTTITLVEVMTVAKARPDERCLQVIVEASGDGDVVAWESFGVSGHSIFVVPEGLPADETFVRSLMEVEYLDLAADLFCEEPGEVI